MKRWKKFLAAGIYLGAVTLGLVGCPGNNNPASPPPTPVPRGPRGLPFVGNALAFTGPHEVPGMNLYRNLFDPKTVKGKWGDTVRISLPVSSAAAAALEAEAGVCDESRSVNETIVTSDPESESICFSCFPRRLPSPFFYFFQF